MNCMTTVPSLSRRTHARWLPATIVVLVMFWPCGVPTLSDSSAQTPPASAAGDGLEIQVNKKGLGKEVVIHKGTKEWYMLVEVAEGNTVVIRQEKEGDTYVMDESETHDRALGKGEIDDVINDFINSVKMRAKGKK